jgi:hypothetical protein
LRNKGCDNTYLYEFNNQEVAYTGDYKLTFGFDRNMEDEIGSVNVRAIKSRKINNSDNYSPYSAPYNFYNNSNSYYDNNYSQNYSQNYSNSNSGDQMGQYLADLRRTYPNGMKVDYKCGNRDDLSLLTIQGGVDVCNIMNSSAGEQKIRYALTEFAKQNSNTLGDEDFMNDLRSEGVLYSKKLSNQTSYTCGSSTKKCPTKSYKTYYLNFDKLAKSLGY